MLLSDVGVLLALVAILALVGVLARAYRRFGLGGAGTRGDAALEVLQRSALGPRQGVALVRMGRRVVMVSMGDGGVRPLAELVGPEADAILATSEAPKGSTFSFMPRTTPVGQPATVPASLFSRNTPPRGAEIFSAALRQAVGVQRVLPLLLVAAMSSSVFAQAAPARPATAPAPTPVVTAPITASTPATVNTQALPSNAANATTQQGAIKNSAATAAQVVDRLAPSMDLRVGNDQQGDGLRLNGTVGVVVMLGMMSLLPTLVLMTTGFTRILVVLYFLRQALGTQTSPPAPLIAGLALILTGFVMAPTMSRVNAEAVTPWLDGKIEQVEMLERGAGPLREFMLKQTRPEDVRRMVRLSRQPVVTGEQVPFVTLMAAFTISELRTAFAIGFALFLPFIVIDVVVASVLMSLGMFMLPPTMIALPFKLLLFVLVDGWGLITQSLVAGFR
ncbi:MAG: flagellar type III secretion system pore protein FliP [Gemmatimonadaceae bacterium]|nr:flagellar type III secretion system pore protein FliP [Gemmatimonadaceae bacterium]